MTELKVSRLYDAIALTIFVEQQESFLRGSLVGMRNDGMSTIIEIDDLTSDRPKINTVITTERAPPGAIIVCNSTVFVSGVLTEVTAYRPIK